MTSQVTAARSHGRDSINKERTRPRCEPSRRAPLPRLITAANNGCRTAAITGATQRGVASSGAASSGAASSGAARRSVIYRFGGAASSTVIMLDAAGGAETPLEVLVTTY